MTKKGRPRKNPAPQATEAAPSETTTADQTPAQSQNEAGAVQENPPTRPAEVKPKERYSPSEKAQIWNGLTSADRRMLGVQTLDEFLALPNITGFGPNSEFTRFHE